MSSLLFVRLLTAIFCAAIFLPLSALAQAKPLVVPLWPKGAPGFESRKNEPEQAKDYWVKNIHNPATTRAVLSRLFGFLKIIVLQKCICTHKAVMVLIWVNALSYIHYKHGLREWPIGSQITIFLTPLPVIKIMSSPENEIRYTS